MAQWIDVKSSDGRSFYGSRCSACHGHALAEESDYGDYYHTVKSKFCPHCGAPMNGPSISMTQKEFDNRYRRSTYGSR